MSACDSSLTTPIRPIFTTQTNSIEQLVVESLVSWLNLQKHPEGGYFVERDRDPLRVPNPFRSDVASKGPSQTAAGG